MNRIALVVSGGTIDREFALEQMRQLHANIIIGVDRGLEFLYQNQILPTHIVGDFDSVEAEVVEYYRTNGQIPIRQFDPVKDATDTEIAVRLAMELGAEEVWILGGTGTRMDHVWANVQTLKIAHDAGVKAYLLDKYNRISLAEQQVTLIKEKAFGTYFSLFSLGGIVQGLTVIGAKYPLENHVLRPYDSLTVSNQFLENEVHIRFSDGVLILMETRDSIQDKE